MVDLTKTDVYADLDVPDEHVEIALKVLRTVRQVYTNPKTFDADKTLLLTRTHALVHDLVVEVQTP